MAKDRLAVLVLLDLPDDGDARRFERHVEAAHTREKRASPHSPTIAIRETTLSTPAGTRP